MDARVRKAMAAKIDEAVQSAGEVREIQEGLGDIGVKSKAPAWAGKWPSRSTR